MKSKSILILSLLMTIIISSCKNEIIENQSLKVNRAEIKEMAALHSKGLQFTKSQKIKTKGFDLEVPGTPVRTALEIFELLAPDIDTYIQNNNLQEYAYLVNVVPGFNIANIPTVSLSQTGQAFSQNYYIILNQMNGLLEPSSYQDLDNQLNIIIGSTDFLSLNAEEQAILISGAEIMLDSYSYWSNNSPQLLATKGFWNRLWAVVQSDARGAWQGGISAFTADKGVGGIIKGAIVGAIQGSELAAELTEDEYSMIVGGNTVNIKGVNVPIEFDNILVMPTTPSLTFPSNYTGLYYYVSSKDLAHEENLIYPTYIFKNSQNIYYYNSGLTCLLPNGVYFNNYDLQYYKVLNGKVTEIGSKPTVFPGGDKPLQELISNLFPNCN